MLSRLLILLLMSASTPVWAQEPEDGKPNLTGSNVTFEAGGHLGNILPNQIPGMTEITGLGGGRMGFRVGHLTFLEGGFMSGSGHGVNWKNIEASVRMDIPVETIVGSVFLGGDVIQYRGVGRSEEYVFGGHLGGAVMSLIGGTTWFRFDMKFNVNPGTSLYIGFGFVFRLTGDTSGNN